MSVREGVITRQTKETEIAIRLDLDGGGNTVVSSGIGFLDHLLESASLQV